MSGQQAAAYNPPPWWRRRPSRAGLEDYLYSLISDHTVGGDSVPLSWSMTKIPSDHPEIEPGLWAAFSNDAFEVAFNHEGADHVALMLRRPILHRFIRWYLWQWSAHEWFGVRRWVWYWLLHRRVNRESIRYKRT